MGKIVEATAVKAEPAIDASELVGLVRRGASTKSKKLVGMFERAGFRHSGSSGKDVILHPAGGANVVLPRGEISSVVIRQSLRRLGVNV